MYRQEKFVACKGMFVSGKGGTKMISKSAEVVPVLHGIDSTYRTGISARELGMSKVLIVTDQVLVDLKLIDPIVENLKSSRVEAIVFSKVVPDPPDYVVEEGATLAKTEKVDGIIAVGGGSAMDAAKAVNMLTANDPPIRQWFFPSDPQGDPLPMIAIPTTAGTGAEASFAAVITDTEVGMKSALMSDRFCKFTLTIQDPKMYAGLPAKPSAYVGFDVLAHTIDSLFSPYNEVYAVAFAEIAIRKIVKFLPRVVKNTQDLEARGEVAFAATLGGNCLNTNMAGNTHTMGHSLGNVLHLPHGLCVALPLASLMEMLYAKWNPKRAQLVGECFGVVFTGQETPEEIGKMTGAAIHKFYLECGIETLSEINPDRELLKKAVAMMPGDMQSPSTYMRVTPTEYQQVIDHMFEL